MIQRIIQLFGTDKCSEIARRANINNQTLAHAWSGRNKVSIDIVKKIHEAIPTASLNWLMFGEGEMYVHPSDDKMVSLMSNEPEDVVEETTPLKTMVAATYNKLYLQSEKNQALLDAVEELKEQNKRILDALDKLTPYL